MIELGSRNEEGDHQLLRPKWKGAQSIQMAHTLNEQFLNLICELAFEPSPASPWPLVDLHRDLWCRLDKSARRRLANFPFVIVDMSFKDSMWWRALAKKQSDVSSGFGAPVAMLSTHRELVALETLMFAWQVARQDLGIAKMVFAMTRSVGDCIAAWSMRQVRDVAAECAQCMRIRWDDDPRLWRELLISAAKEDEADLMARRRDAKLLFCGELLESRVP